MAHQVTAALYCRQSVDLTEGIQRQEARARALAEQRGYRVTRVFQDNAQSASKARTATSAWSQMLRDHEAGAFTHVIATNLDRLTRSQRDLLTLIDAGVRVVTVDGEIDLTSAEGEFQAVLLTGFARMEVARKAERQRRANDYRTSMGRPVPGRRRYGYEPDNMTPRPDEAAVVAYMFEALAENGSVRDIAQTLNREGKAATTGTGMWTPRRVRETLTNRSYIGEVRHLGTWTESSHVLPIVDADLFERVQTLLADPTRKTSPGADVRHLLSGLAFCGVCGSRMTFMRSYRCRSAAAHPSIKKESLEAIVMRNVVAALLLGPSAILPAIADEEGSLAAVHDAMRRIQDRREGLMELVREGLTDAAAERPTLTRLKDEERRLAARRDQLTQSSVAAEVLAGIKSALFDGHRADLQKAAEARRALLERVGHLNLHQHRELISMLLHVTVNPGRTADRVHVMHRIVSSLNADDHDTPLDPSGYPS